ncbi:ArnT family glycosyltransferase [Leptolyngbyaceae cyanobacterium UHCC 1019]
MERLLAKHRIDWGWAIALWLAAVLLFMVGLGGVPLRDWDEGIVAQVAKDIWWAQTNPTEATSFTWLYPTLGNLPYQNKPTLIHWLIAQCYAISGVNEWTARFPGAFLTSFSIPLLYFIGRELFPKRTPAIFSALILLVLLPFVRHGRLAMLDGALVSFSLVMFYSLLRMRRDLRWGLGVGAGIGLMCLTKGLIGVLMGAIALLFILWDTPRLLTSGYLWGGLALGIAPFILWYWAQVQRYGTVFLDTHLVNQSLSRAWNAVENNSGPPWYYLLELLKYTLPWLIFLPQGFRLAWEHRGLGWAKLVLAWAGGYLLTISLMQTKLPWYILPLYPAVALVGGVVLATIWEPADVFGFRWLTNRPYPKVWKILLGILAIAAAGFSIYFSPIGLDPTPTLTILSMMLTITLTSATVLAMRQDSQFVLVLIWGSYISLLMLMVSPYWVWELQEQYPVKPVAAMLKQHTPAGESILTSHPYGRPSLNFYSDRWVSPIAPDAIAQRWQQDPPPYLLTDQPTLDKLNLKSLQQIAAIDYWILVKRRGKS